MRIHLTLALLLTSLIAPGQVRTLFLDADTANEVDDLYAIVLAFAEPTWRIPVLASTQWQNSQWATERTMEDSYRLNQHLATHLGVQDSTQVVRGGHRRMYDWGHMAVHSHASDALIALSQNHDAANKLTVVALGALTNVASALYLDPTLAERMEVYWLGSTYDFDTHRARFTDFNALMDPQAAQLVLEHPTLRVHVLPVNEVGMHTVTYKQVEEFIAQESLLADLLLDRWRGHMDGSKATRVLWDLAIIQILRLPVLAVELEAPGYGGENVTAYTNLIGEELFNRALAGISLHLTALQKVSNAD